MPTKLSGHARLKRALVLRDALAAETGITLPVAWTMPKFSIEPNVQLFLSWHDP